MARCRIWQRNGLRRFSPLLTLRCGRDFAHGLNGTGWKAAQVEYSESSFLQTV
jgi:hypothetical protein